MFRIIQELKPSWVIGENVANFVNMELERTLINLENEGYETQTFIIPACGVDAKHQRNRTFVVANSKGEQFNGAKHNPRISNENEGKFGGDGSKTNILSYTASFRLQRQRDFIQSFNTKENQNRETSESINVCKPSKWAVEPNVGRVANGIPNRMDRLKGLGNAVVPQQIYPIFKYIMEIERMNKE